MFHLFSKKHKRPDPMPAWMKWAVAAFIIYAIANGGGKNDDLKMPNGLSGSRQIADEYKGRLLGRHQPFATEIVLEGKGAPVYCGQQVSIAYRSVDETGSASGDIKKDQFRIGTGKAMPKIERAVLGMRVGGKNRVTSDADMAPDTDGGKKATAALPVRFEVELLEASPALPDLSKVMFRAFDSAPGSGTPVVCGQPVKAHVTVWNMEGKNIFSTKTNAPLSLTPGKSEVAMGIEIGITGMREGGKRTIIIPPALAKPMHGNKPPAGISLPAGQTAIVDIEIPK